MRTRAIVAATTVAWLVASHSVQIAGPIESGGRRGRDSSAVGQRGTTGLRLSELVPETAFRSDMENWRVSQQNLYQIRYEKSVSITLAAEASGFLVDEYLKRDLDPVFKQDPQLSRFVIRRDVGAVLSSAFEASIRAKYTTWASFLKSTGTAVAISVDNVRAGLESQDCNVIPCPPNKCKPDCSANSFKRFGQLSPPGVALR